MSTGDYLDKLCPRQRLDNTEFNCHYWQLRDASLSTIYFKLRLDQSSGKCDIKIKAGDAVIRCQKNYTSQKKKGYWHNIYRYGLFNIFDHLFTHINTACKGSLLNAVRLDMAEAHCGAAFEWYQQTSSDSFTPRRAGHINAAVTPATRAGVSYHRTQAFLLLAHCCCHSSAPPERLPHQPPPRRQHTSAQNENQRKWNTNREGEGYERSIRGRRKIKRTNR